MPPIDATLLQAIRLLHDAGVRFIAIGGVAMIMHGCAHITTDVDFAYARDRENLRALADALRGQHAKLRGVPDDVPFLLDECTFHNVQNLTLETDLGEIDLLATPAGIDSFEGLWERSVEMDLGDFTVRAASIDDLIAMKRAANRLKDQNHILELLALKKLIAQQTINAQTQAPDSAKSGADGIDGDVTAR